jgi:hypothetical protein
MLKERVCDNAGTQHTGGIGNGELIAVIAAAHDRMVAAAAVKLADFVRAFFPIIERGEYRHRKAVGTNIV